MILVESCIGVGLILMLPCEVFPAAWLQGSAASGGICDGDRSPTRHAADAGDADPGHAARHPQFRRSGKQELIVFAAVEGEFNRAVWPGLHRQRMDWQRGSLNLRSDARLAAQVREVGGEPIAEVDRGRRQPTPQQRKPDINARLRVYLWMRSGAGWPIFSGLIEKGGLPLAAPPLHCSQLGSRAAQFAGYIQRVAGATATAPECTSSWG